MTSRERILASIRHTEPDRLPIDCGAMRSTGIQAIAYHHLKEHAGMAELPTRIFDVVQQLAEPDERYLDMFHIDAVNAGRDFHGDRWKDWTLPQGVPCQVPEYMDFRPEGDDWLACNADGEPVARMIEGATYFNQACHPLACDNWTELLDQIEPQMNRVCWASLPEPLFEYGLSDEGLRRIAEHLRHLRQTSDRAIMIAFGGNLFEWASYLRRMDNFLLDLIAEPADAEALLDKLVELHLANLDRLLPVVGDHVDLIQLGDDLGMENGTIFSPQMFRELFKPRYRMIIERIKKLSPNMIVFLHSCGSIYDILPDLIEVGVEVINPVQIGAKNMEPARLKSEFGRDVTFWGGGCDTQHVLATATPQEVRDHVRRNIETFAPGGGYVFNQVHNILSEVPPANVVAMYEAAME